MRTVYAVSLGAYSDYAVSCLFETAEDAKRYREAMIEADVNNRRDWPSFDEKLTRRAVASDIYIEEFDLYDKGEAPVVTK